MTTRQARQRHPPRDLKAVEATIRRLRRARLPHVQGISRRELRRIREYTLENDPWTWEKIVQQRGPLSYALLLHEQAEMKYYQQREVNPFNRQAWQELYEEAHAHALRVEHEFLRKLAESRGYRGLNLGTLVAMNKSVRPESRKRDAALIRRYWGRKDAKVIETATSLAEAFYEEVMGEWG